MGTRGNVVIRQHKTGRIILNMYNHMDSYPSGLGQTLADFLKDRKIINGIGNDTYKVSNGIGCMAAQLVAELKEGIGGIYIEPPVFSLKDTNDYTYLIYPVTKVKSYKLPNGKKRTWHDAVGGLMVNVYNWEKKIFEGTANEFSEWVKTAD